MGPRVRTTPNDHAPFAGVTGVVEPFAETSTSAVSGSTVPSSESELRKVAKFFPLLVEMAAGGGGELSMSAKALVAFGVKGGLDAGRKLIDTVELWSLLANIGDTRSLIIHPASTTHQQLSAEERAASGVTDDMVRLSVGLEHVPDLIDALDRALETV